MSEGENSASRPAGWSLDPFGVWEAWARALEINAPLSGDVTQAIRAALVEHLGQMGLINLNIDSSADPALERRIVAEVATYGRQLGWILAALDALVRAQRGESAQDGDEAALDRVAELRAHVQAVSAARPPSASTAWSPTSARCGPTPRPMRPRSGRCARASTATSGVAAHQPRRNR